MVRIFTTFNHHLLMFCNFAKYLAAFGSARYQMRLVVNIFIEGDPIFPIIPSIIYAILLKRKLITNDVNSSASKINESGSKSLPGVKEEIETLTDTLNDPGTTKKAKAKMRGGVAAVDR